jgi:enoyl-CoA hydratase/carnithine racemase
MSYDDYNAVRIDLAGGVATVTIDNAPINLIDFPLFAELGRLGTQLAGDDEVRVVVIRSANPDFFITHFDVGLILMFPTEPGPPATELNAFHAMCETFRTMPKPTIAVIEGRVGGGGCEFISSCDMRFADVDTAYFNQPEVALGILPGGSGTVRLPRLIGRGRAMEMVLGCDDIDAATADAWGLVNRALPQAQLWPYVDRLAQRIAGFPAHAVAMAKASVLRADGDLKPDLLAEGNDFMGTLGNSVTQAAMKKFMATGGQTREGELRIAELATELNA